MFYLGESTLLVVTRLLEIRILYIKKFRPGPYTPEVVKEVAAVEGGETLTSTMATGQPSVSEKIDKKRR